jgi:predicted Zn-dependent peptidase
MIDLLHLRDTYWDWWLARRHQGLPFNGSSEAIAEKVRRLDQPALAELHRTLFRPESSALVAVGDVAAAQVRSAFERRFGAWHGAPLAREAGPAAATPPSVARAPRTGRKIAVFDESGYPFVTLLQDAPAPDSKDAIAFELLTEILASSGEASLISKLRFEHGHAYSAWAGTVTVPGSGRYLLLRTAVAAETLVQDLGEMLRVLERHRTTIIAPSTLEGAKALYGGQLALALASASGVARYLAHVELGATPPLEQVQARLAAVTPSDLQSVAQRYLNPDLATVVVTGDVTQAVRALGQLGEVSVE